MDDFNEEPKTIEVEDERSADEDMDGILNDLSAVLDKEIACYKDLLEAARDEQKAIIHGKLNELKLAVEAEENLIGSTRALDEVRQNVVSMIAHRIGCEGNNIKLRDIIEKADPVYRSRLNKLRDELHEITKDLDLVNRANAQLIKSSIDFINETMWILLQADKKKEPVYDSNGKGKQETKTRVLVDRLG